MPSSRRAGKRPTLITRTAMAARGPPFLLAVLAVAGGAWPRAALAAPASALRLGLPGLPGLQTDWAWDFGGPAPLLQGLQSRPTGGLHGPGLDFGGASFGGPGFSFNLAAGSAGPSGVGASWAWPGADALGDAGDGLLQQRDPGPRADTETPPAVVGVVAPLDPFGGPSEDGGGFAAWTSLDAPLVGDLVRGLASGASSLRGSGMFGKPPPEEGIVFNLFTRKDPSPRRLFARNASSIRGDTTFDPKKKTKLIIHGFTGHNKPNSGGHLVKDAVLRVLDANVITVDWSLVDPRFYPTDVATTVPMVGAAVADLVGALPDVDLDDVHIIGHSLGAHIAGVAGSLSLGPAGKGWITGLDPAGPMFEGQPPAARLDTSDAGFVEAVHTDGGKLGITQPVAHVDYHVDGGRHPLPGCGTDTFGACSHCFAFEVYAFAVAHPGAMMATKCDSAEDFQGGACSANERLPLGLNPDRRSRGVFHVDSVEKPSELLRAVGHGSLSSVLLSGLSKLRKPSASGAHAQPDDKLWRC